MSKIRNLDLNDQSIGYIFTDGSCQSATKGKGSWAFLIIFKNKIHRISGVEELTTGNRMELLAAINAFILAKYIGVRKAVWISDSRYCLDGLGDWAKKWIAFKWKRSQNGAEDSIKNVDLWKKLVHQATGIKEFEMCWVKSHSGNYFNEIVDQMCSAYVAKEYPSQTIEGQLDVCRVQHLYTLDHDKYNPHRPNAPGTAKKKEENESELKNSKQLKLKLDLPYKRQNLKQESLPLKRTISLEKKKKTKPSNDIIQLHYTHQNFLNQLKIR